MKRSKDKRRKRFRRKLGIRAKIKGTAERPRVSVFKSGRYTYIQAIDDDNGQTLASVSNLEKDLKQIRNKVGEIVKLGTAMGARLKEAKISQIVFDRNGYLYHGRIKDIADGIRKTGITF